MHAAIQDGKYPFLSFISMAQPLLDGNKAFYWELLYLGAAWQFWGNNLSPSSHETEVKCFKPKGVTRILRQYD